MQKDVSKLAALQKKEMNNWIGSIGSTHVWNGASMCCIIFAVCHKTKMRSTWADLSLLKSSMF